MRTVCSMEKGYSTACFSVPSPPPAPDCPQRDSWSENSQHHFMRLVFRSWNCWHHLCTRVKGQRCEDLFWQIVSCQVSEVLSCSAYMLITAVQTFESVPKVDPTLFSLCLICLSRDSRFQERVGASPSPPFSAQASGPASAPQSRYIPSRERIHHHLA